MKLFILILVFYLVAVNVVTFFVYGYDKALAKRHRRRVSEAALLTLAAIGGAAGALAGMYLWRHKTRHAAFVYGVPALLVLQLAAAVAALLMSK